MKTILTYEELQNIPVGVRVHKLENGQETVWNMLGTFQNDNHVMMAQDNVLEKSKCFRKADFKPGIWTREPQNIPMGRILIEQVLRRTASEIESINAVYIKSDLGFNKQFYVKDLEKYIDEETKRHSK